MGSEMCIRDRGNLNKEQILLTDGTTQQVKNKSGSIFYCNSKCYGVFFEAEKKASIRGRAIIYDEILDNCPASLVDFKRFDISPYRGPRQKVSKKKK